MLLLLLGITFLGEYLPFVDRELNETKYIWNEKHIPIAPPYAPSEDFILGSDRLGRDLLSLLIIGAKETLLFVVLITIIRYTMAVPLAYLAYKRIAGAQSIINWLNGALSYVPTIIIIVLFATLPPILTIDERPLYMMLLLASVEIGRVAKMVKHEIEDLTTKDFILGGISVGASSFRLIRKYYLPFLYDKILINMVTDLGKVMFLVGQLGFIGIFLSQELVQVDPGKFEILNRSITWPTFFMDSFRDIRASIWIPFYPALAITYTILTFNVLAQGLQNLFKKNTNFF
ncbi:peptide ABC transporter permease [Neobacillus sp. D3-1R]|uniref:peptide ABC transporter permease n=1 Tax=Neobacillus sp. D3-1R TaxID=3445778 RepID=UPI003F9F5FB6